jgi:hypothetical protein
MSPKNFHPLISLASLLISISMAVVPLHASAQIPVTGDLSIGSSSPVTAYSPSLTSFIEQVKNGSAREVTGLYIKSIFSFPVIQQPGNQPAYVSQNDDQLTQFQSASAFGSLGFVAHNTLAGASFPEITNGDLIAVVYGDGHYSRYLVVQVRRFQALQPNNPYSSFIDLSTSKVLSVEDVFYQTYGVSHNLVLQTCISNQGVDSWGRLFVVAVPYNSAPSRTAIPIM